jgi:uncharacterized protein (TIGR03437 family)
MLFSLRASCGCERGVTVRGLRLTGPGFGGLRHIVFPALLVFFPLSQFPTWPALAADNIPAAGHFVPPSPQPPSENSRPTLIALSSMSLSFESVAGAAQGSTQGLQIILYSDFADITWNAKAQTDNGGNWLSISPTFGRDDAILSVSVTPGSLPKGTYTGKIIITAPQANNSPATVPVTYTIRDRLPSVLRLSTGALTFFTIAETQSPAPQQVLVSKDGETDLTNWRVSFLTFNGGSWLSVNPVSGLGPGSFTVTASLGSLPPGIYAGKITIAAGGMTNSPVSIAVTFTVGRPKAAFSSQGIVNAASLQPGALAPGEIVSVFGSHLGPRDAVAFQLDPITQKIPLSLAGTTVTFDGVRAPLFLASWGQINLQVPYEVAGKTAARMTVSAAGFDPGDMVVPIADAAPGVFTLDGVRAAVLNEDSTLNTPDNPAQAGRLIQVFLTGQGLFSPKVETGALAPLAPPFPALALPVAVTIDGIPARIAFSGTAPGMAGLAQVNAEVPAGVAPSDRAKLVVAVGAASAAPVMIAVR